MTITSTLPEQLISSKDLASYLGITRSTLGRLAKKGDLHPVTVGNQHRYRSDDVERFLEPAEKSASPV
jgi:excisionase family DNA binding protein